MGTGKKRNYLLPRVFTQQLERRILLAVDSPAVEVFNTSPAVFVENAGQWADADVRFVHQGKGANIALTDTGATFQLYRDVGATPASPSSPNTGDTGVAPTPLGERFDPHREPAELVTAQFSVRFDGSSPTRPVGHDRSAASFNYFVGDASTHRSNVAGYEKIVYNNLYAGIDLHTWGKRDHLKYEFHVAPGADYTQIRVHYDGIEGLSIDESGRLLARIGGEWNDQVIDEAPFIYQVIHGKQVEIKGNFRLIDQATYGFELAGNFDPAVMLVIDPELAWATYLGGSGDDYARGISVDGAGNAYVAGYTESTNFAGANNTFKGSYDAFVAKISASGSLAWATYLGGSGGDYGYGISVDGAGNAYVAGWSGSSDFAGANNTFKGGFSDAFVAKVSGSGLLAWATYLGGSDADYGYGISVDGAGNAYVAGWSGSSDFAGANNTFKGGVSDAFVAKLSVSGSLAWATYLGGSDGHYDFGFAISVDGAGNAYVAGYTESTNFAGANNTFKGGVRDAFVAKVSASGSLAWATYLGGSRGDFGYGISVDSAGNAYVTGQTYSTNFAGANNTYNGSDDAFVAKVSASGSLAWATYLGGNWVSGGYGISLDGAGNAYVTGYTHSTNFPGANNTYTAAGDGFVAKISPSGSLVWATYLGGGNWDFGHAIAVDGAGNAYVTGYTGSSAFAGANNTFKGGYEDAFVTKITDAALALAPPPNVQSTDGEFTNRIRITWDAVAGAESYEVWRNDLDDPTTATRLAENVPPAFDDDYTAEPAKEYFYWVRAVSATGVSEFSASDSGYRARQQPWATLAWPLDGQLIDAKKLEYIDVKFHVVAGATLDVASIIDTEPEFRLTGGAVSGVKLKPAFAVDGQANTWRYFFKGKLGLGRVSIQFIADSFADSFGMTNLPSSARFTIGAVEINEDARRGGVGKKVPVTIRRTNGKMIDPDLPTWVLIHGRLGSASAMLPLAGAVDAYQAGDQVLTLDWEEGASANDLKNLGVLDFTGEDWIKVVANVGAGLLQSYGIAGEKLNLIGHSWGSYVAAELAEVSGGVDTIVVLDPPQDVQPKETRLGGGALLFGGLYNPDAAGEIDFARDSRFSWAFRADQTWAGPVNAGYLGSQHTLRTADETFFVQGADHYKILNVLEDLMRHSKGDFANAVGVSFNLGRLLAHERGPWLEDQYDEVGRRLIGGYEGVIKTTDGGKRASSLSYIDELGTEQTILA